MTLAKRGRHKGDNMSYELDPNTVPRNGAPVRIPVPGMQRGIGLGDVIAGLTKALGIQPCNACERRRRWLNQRIQLGGRR